jgi:hypothetical protein
MPTWNSVCKTFQVHPRRYALFLAVIFLFNCIDAHSQNLGHKLPGLLGLDAVKIPEPGLYLLDRAARFEAGELRDRNGDLVPTGPLDLVVSANSFGISYTKRISSGMTFLTMTAGGPIARVKIGVANRPDADLDRFGMGDFYIQPVRLGWRRDKFDVITGYGIYLPPDRSALAGGSGTSSGNVTHEFSGGASRYFAGKSYFVTALASYQLNMRQRGIDITRGDTFQIVGGAGTRLFGQMLETGLASFALWQVRDDRGTGLPPVLRGLSDRVYGLGPEAAIFIKPIRGQVRVRYEWDVGVRSRPQGSILVIGFNLLIHAPKQPGP